VRGDKKNERKRMMGECEGGRERGRAERTCVAFSRGAPTHRAVEMAVPNDRARAFAHRDKSNATSSVERDGVSVPVPKQPGLVCGP
jgi:hypothetical protein